MWDQLAQKGIKPRHTDVGTSQKIKCPECQPHSHNPKDNPLSLTISFDGAVWNCHHCGFSGGIGENSQRNKPKKFETPVVPEVKKKENFLYDYFKKRGISKDTVDKFRIFNENNWIAFQYFDENGSLCNVKYRTVDKKFRQSPNAKRIVYNYDQAAKAETVVFVEGEMDVLSIAEACDEEYVAVSLPDGAPSEAKFNKNDQRFKSLENSPLVAKKVIIFTDKDSSGIALHKELLHRIGKDICWRVQIPDNCKDANDVLMKHGSLKLREIIESAEPYPVDGLYRATDYKQQVYDLYDGNYVKPISVGLEGLDDIYKVMTGTFHVYTGIPNHGKSLMLDMIMMNLAENHEWKFAIFSPEHSSQMHIRRLAQMYIGKNFDEGFKEKMTRRELDYALEFIDKHFYFIETKDAVPNIELITSIAKKAVYKYGCHLIIDPYNEVDASRSGAKREDEHIRDFISTLKRFARVHEKWVAVVAHPTKLPKSNDGAYLPPTAYDISGAAHWHNQADAIICIHRDFEDNTVSFITRKIREQDLYGSIGTATFVYDLETKRFKPRREAIDWEWSDDITSNQRSR